MTGGCGALDLGAAGGAGFGIFDASETLGVRMTDADGVVAIFGNGSGGNGNAFKVSVDGVGVVTPIEITDDTGVGLSSVDGVGVAVAMAVADFCDDVASSTSSVSVSICKSCSDCGVSGFESNTSVFKL